MFEQVLDGKVEQSTEMFSAELTVKRFCNGKIKGVCNVLYVCKYNLIPNKKLNKNFFYFEI